jgi:hypothetical protein
MTVVLAITTVAATGNMTATFNGVNVTNPVTGTTTFKTIGGIQQVIDAIINPVGSTSILENATNMSITVS